MTAAPSQSHGVSELALHGMCDTRRDSNTGVRWRAEEGATGLASLSLYTGHHNPSLGVMQHELCVSLGPFVDLHELEPSWREHERPNALWYMILCRSAVSTYFDWHSYKKVVHL